MLSDDADVNDGTICFFLFDDSPAVLASTAEAAVAWMGAEFCGSFILSLPTINASSSSFTNIDWLMILREDDFELLDIVVGGGGGRALLDALPETLGSEVGCEDDSILLKSYFDKRNLGSRTLDGSCCKNETFGNSKI